MLQIVLKMVFVLKWQDLITHVGLMLNIAGMKKLNQGKLELCPRLIKVNVKTVVQFSIQNQMELDM